MNGSINIKQYDFYYAYLNLGEALEQLHEMVKEPEDRQSYVKEATIKRFEFCFEIFWRTLKKICIYEGYAVTSPRSAFEKAFDLKFMDDAALWALMLEDRNQTSHTYKRKIASEIYYRIKNYYPAMQKTFLKIKEKYKF